MLDKVLVSSRILSAGEVIKTVATLEILESLGKILKGNLSTQLPNTVIFKPYFQYLILERIFKQETTRKKGTALFHKTRITHNLI
jgi:hypothetical protein